jgi:hypothetical protein
MLHALALEPQTEVAGLAAEEGGRSIRRDSPRLENHGHLPQRDGVWRGSASLRKGASVCPTWDMATPIGPDSEASALASSRQIGAAFIVHRKLTRERPWLS